MFSNTKLFHLENFQQALTFRFSKFCRYDNSFYWKDYYSKKLANSDTSREKMYAQIIFQKCGKNAKVLDIGSGFGFLAKELSDLGLQVTCVDYFEEMLDEARKYLKGTSVKLVKSDILSIPLEKEDFDCVVLMSVIEHFPRKETEEDILPYVKEFIKPDGFLFIHVPVKSIHSIFARFFRKFFVGDLPSWAIDDDADVTHKFWISARDYTKMITAHGFNLDNYDFRLTRSNMKPLALAKIMKKIQEITEKSDQNFVYTTASLPTHLRVIKWFKSQFALTAYFLFKRIK